MTDALGARWLAFHLHYHERQDRLLEDLLRPLVASLLQRREIDSFFFVRSFLGGPHLRLRLRPCGDRDAVAGEVRSAAERFFSASPSRASLPAERILELNRGILENDPTESDPAVYPDNSVRQAPFHPEIERYGGPELFPESLAFFAVSSGQVLRWLHRQAGEPRSRLSSAFHLLGLQALGFARDGQELVHLLRYPMAEAGTGFSRLVEKGNEAFERQKGSYVQALRQRIEAVVDGPLLDEDLRAERRLEGGLREAAARARILSSQLHMTANRLGLLNPEEVYLARLLERTFTEVARSEPALWSRLEEALAARASSGSVKDLLPAALEEALADVSSSP